MFLHQRKWELKILPDRSDILLITENLDGEYDV